MRLGAPVTGYTSPEEWIAIHKERGYGAAYCPVKPSDPKAKIQEYIAAAREHNLVIAEVGIWNNLLAQDPMEKEQNIRISIERLAFADKIGARCAVNISGSCGKRWDGPHPQNLTEQTFEEIVRISNRILEEVQPKTVKYALEPMPWAYPNSRESAQKLIDCVNHPQFGVHVDMANLINSIDRVYHTGELTKDFFGHLGSFICSVHAKDSQIVEDRLTMHIDEAIPGEGIFDFDTLLQCCAALGDVPVLAEHLQTQEQYEKATSYLKKVAERNGLQWDAAK
ncbi:MAG: sugar phosphate isomerase/epimerase [Clostridia bacterium]|nr:sugar phosphate isomerase/epimerase [Clostridia bacterium]